MEVHEIRTRPDASYSLEDLPKNQPRAFVRLVSGTNHVAVRSECVIQHAGDAATVQFYAGELRDLAERVRTDAHRTAWANAIELCNMERQRWYQEAGKSYPGDDYLADLECNLHPAQFLPFPKGLPPFEQAQVIHPDDVYSDKPEADKRAIDLNAWLALGLDEQEAWLIGPPEMAENAHDRLAQALTRAMGRDGESADSGGHGHGGGRGRRRRNRDG